MRALATLFVASGLMADVAPIGIVRGELLEWQVGTQGAGDFSVRSANSQVYSCHFDNYTYLERDNQRIGVSGLKPGEKLEIIADQKLAGKCYARTIRVVENKPAIVNPGYRVNLRPMRTVADLVYPRGNVTFAGVVLRMNPGMMVLHTRTEGEKTILLRADTRYMDSGLPAERSALPVNTRVFIRGGKNLENELEAYQVIWGEIEGPKH